MSEPTAVPPRSRGGRALSAVLPGAPQLLAGRVGAGAAALIVWIGSLAVLLTSWSRVRGALAGSLDEWIALLTLVSGLVGAWTWSWRDVGQPPMRWVG